jgi:hypothetical protein
MNKLNLMVTRAAHGVDPFEKFAMNSLDKPVATRITECFLAGSTAVLVSSIPDSLPPEWCAGHEKRAARGAELGEAWPTHFDADGLRAELMALGLSEGEDLGPPQIAAHYFPNRAITLPDKGGHILRATTV